MLIDPFVFWGVIFVLGVQFVYNVIEYGRDGREHRAFAAVSVLARVFALAAQVGRP